MAVSQVGSTTTSYYVTNGTNGASTSSKTATSSSKTVSSATTRSGTASTTSSATTVSSTTAVSSTTKGSGSASTTSSTTVISSTTSYASATAKATCSTTVTYSGSSSTAKVSSTTVATVETTTTEKVGISSSTTASTTINTTSITNKTANINSGGTPVYAYLSHMGGEAIEKAKNILIDLGYEGNIEEKLNSFSDDIGLSEYTTHSYEVTTKLFEVGAKLDSIKNVLDKKGFLVNNTNLREALGKFKDYIGMDESDIFDKEVIAEIDKLDDYYSKNEYFKIQLQELGFYNPESGKIDPSSVKADSSPSNVEKSIENFCKVYGVDYNITDMDTIKSKIDEVYKYYTGTLYSSKIDSMLNALEDVKGKLVESQKINFCKSLTFLKHGMKFTYEKGKELSDDKKDALIAGILANWCEEGFFSETNAQDGTEHSGLDNSEDYKYEIDDKVGFGIMQWTYFSRKQALIDRAAEMDSGVGNINTQFAMVRYETEVDRTEREKWIAAISGVDEGIEGVELARKYAFNYYDYVEGGSAPSEKKRETYAEIIYKGLVGEKYE